MKKNLTKERLINVFLIFCCLSIFLDFHIFYNSISTLIRTLIISILFLIIVFLYNKPKDKKNLFLYFFLVIIFIICHHINALNFKSLVPNNFNYSLIQELLYFIKMISNVMIFYIIYRLNIQYINIKKYLKIIITIMTLSIIITDLFSFSYTAYNFEKTSIPIFKWFILEKYDFMSGSSKGLFHMTNQIVALFLLYLPIIIYETHNEKKITNYLLVLGVIISMIMIGNRLAIYGTLIELIILVIVYFFLNIKKKLNKLFYIFIIAVIIGILIIIPFSPLTMRGYYYDAIYNHQNIDFIDEKNTNKGYENQINLDNKDDILQKFDEKNIDPQFTLKSYPYNYDLEFWEDLSKKDISLTGNARYVELSMIKRVKEINNNWLDNLFGITYSRIMNIFNIEQDFIMQYYSIGIIGCILFLGLYFILIIYCGVKILFDLKNKFNEKNISLILGTTFVFFSAYYSGNILNSISMIIPLTMLLSVLVNEVKKKQTKDKKEKILGFDVSTNNMETILDNIFNAKDKVFVVNINPLIVLDHYKDAEKKKIFNNQLIQIPDGEGIVLVSKLRGGNIEKRIAGIDLMLEVCKNSIKYRSSIFLYGAKDGVAKKAKEKLERQFNNINIVGTISGYEEEQKVIKDINTSKAKILFVALGSPKQEDFIIRNKDKLKYVKIFIPVGGSFDVISGNLKRAPRIFQTLKLEWLYRMILEPKRLKGIFKLLQFIILSIFER